MALFINMSNDDVALVRRQMLIKEKTSYKEMKEYVFELLNSGTKLEEAEKLAKKKFGAECSTDKFVALVNEWQND